MKIDIMVTAPATGNINYINWVKAQTVLPLFEKDQKKELPEPATNTTIEATQVETPEAAPAAANATATPAEAVKEWAGITVNHNSIGADKNT